VKKLSWLLVTTSSLTLTSCLSSGGQSSSSASSSSSAMFWNVASFPLTIKASSDFDASNRALLNDMAYEWEDLGVQADATDDYNFFSASSGGTLTAVADPNHASVSSYRDSTLGIYLLNNWPSDFSSSALAVTQLWGIRGGNGISISHFDIFYNDDLYDFYTNPADAGVNPNTYDMGTIALHELGHALGLNHISTVPSNSAVMYPYLGISTVKRTVRDCDLRAIADNYGWSTDSTLCPEAIEPDGSTLALNPASTSNITEEQLDAAGIKIGDELGIVMELRTDGTCHHIVNGHDVFSHKVDFKFKSEHDQDDFAHSH
jgi:hypothetical protein